MKVRRLISATLAAISASAAAQDNSLESLLGNAGAQVDRPAEAQNSEAPANQQPQAPAASSPDAPSSSGTESTTRSPADASATVGVPPPAETKTGNAQEARQIEEIIVTATKRDASIRDVPVSIDAFRGKDLVNQGATNLDGILKNTPGVNVSGTKIDIRGVALTSQLSLGGGEETGRFFGDASLNAPSTEGGLGDFDPYDMSSVEVLKGPQSTLFGGTALAGAIRYVPNKPLFDGFAGSIRAGYGDVVAGRGPLKDLSAMVNIPASDKLAFRATGTYRYKPNVTVDTFGHLPNTDSDKTIQTRYMGRWAPTEHLSFDGSYLSYNDRRYFTFLDQPHSRTTNLKRMEEPVDTRLYLYTLKAQYDFEPLSVVALANELSNGFNWRLDSAPVLGVSRLIGAVPYIINSKVTSPSYELRLVSNHPSESSWFVLRDWDYLAGLYYMRADQNASEVLLVTGLTAASTVLNVKLSEEAFFVNLTRHLFDGSVDWNMGARLAKTVLNGIDAVSDAGVPRQFQAIQPEKRINPTAALTWHISEDVNVRASYGQGFRFGGVNGAVTVGIENIPPSFRSDSLSNYEMGLRSDWFGHTLRIDVTPFEIRWKNLQLYQISPLGFGYIANVGAAKIDGIETGITWKVPDDWSVVPAGLTLASSFSYLRARTTEAFNSANGAAAAGTRLPLSPKASAALALMWHHHWDAWDGSVTVQGFYSGSRKNDLIETYHLSGYDTLAASVRIARLGWLGDPAISVSGTNLTNKFILYNATPVVSQPGQFVFAPQGDPRTVKLSLEFAFE